MTEDDKNKLQLNPTIVNSIGPEYFKFKCLLEIFNSPGFDLTDSDIEDEYRLKLIDSMIESINKIK
jgi:hypothetical protein